MARFKKGSAQAKAWGRKMQRLRSGKVYKSHTPKQSMAKRRRSSGRKYSRHRKSSGISSNIVKIALIGGAGVLAYDLFLRPKLGMLGSALPLVELGAGFYLAKKSGFVGDFGKVMFIVGTVGLMNQYVAPALSGVSGITATNTQFL